MGRLSDCTPSAAPTSPPPKPPTHPPLAAGNACSDHCPPLHGAHAVAELPFQGASPGTRCAAGLAGRAGCAGRRGDQGPAGVIPCMTRHVAQAPIRIPDSSWLHVTPAPCWPGPRLPHAMLGSAFWWTRNPFGASVYLYVCVRFVYRSSPVHFVVLSIHDY